MAARSRGRIFGVTAALLASGAAFGALAAVLAALIGLTATGQSWVRYHVNFLPLIALVGAVLGAPLLPVTAWLFLRRVPLGLSLAGTFAGAVAGGIVGWMLPGTPADLMFGAPAGWLSLQEVHAVLGGVFGFALAAVVLRVRFAAGRVERPVARAAA